MKLLLKRIFNLYTLFILLPIIVILTFVIARDGGRDNFAIIPPPLQINAQFPELYSRATGPKPFEFPLDHGPHNDYQTEWWYYTGNLISAEGARFGYQLTFFRRAIEPEGVLPERESEWAADQLYLAHFALTDVRNKAFFNFERYSRSSLGIAGAQAQPYQVWLEDWEVRAITPSTHELHAHQDGIRITLLLDNMKGPILQGDRGYSQKGADPGNASYYYSLTRLESSGSIRIGDQTHVVTGLSWMDHEYSTSALGADQVGWDWFSMQLNDGSEIMLFQLRREDGSLDPFTSGTLIAHDGSTAKLSYQDFNFEVLETWTSPHTSAEYPSRWKINIPTADIELEIEPLILDQELTVSFVYWEGATQITGTKAGQPIAGYGYLEMTGYAHSMQVQF